MRRILIGIGIVVAAWTAGVQPGFADPRPYCLSGNKSNGGMPDCTYYSLAQCRGSMGGGNDSCYENPALMWKAREQGRVQPASRRQTRDRY